MDLRTEPLEVEIIKERSQLAAGETDEERHEWEAEETASRDRIPAVEKIPDLLAFIREKLDPRVILEAEDMGCGPDAIAEIKERMGEWARAVASRPEGESFAQRQIRFRELHERLYPENKQGCGCRGTGFVSERGDFRRRDGKQVHGVEFLKLCSCDRGKGKLDYLKEKLLGRKRKDGGKSKNDEDGIPF